MRSFYQKHREILRLNEILDNGYTLKSTFKGLKKIPLSQFNRTRIKDDIRRMRKTFPQLVWKATVLVDEKGFQWQRKVQGTYQRKFHGEIGYRKTA